jgi:hypothetical protein
VSIRYILTISAAGEKISKKMKQPMTGNPEIDALGILKELSFYNWEIIRDMVGQIDRDKAMENYMKILDAGEEDGTDKV